MMSQRAPPEVNGFGTTTSLSPLATSSQVWMSFGLPLRVMNTTVESWMMPSYWVSAQFRSERVRHDDLVVAAGDVVPGLDVVRVALAGDEHDGRVLDDAVVLGVGPIPI